MCQYLFSELKDYYIQIGLVRFTGSAFLYLNISVATSVLINTCF